MGAFVPRHTKIGGEEYGKEAICCYADLGACRWRNWRRTVEQNPMAAVADA